MSKKILVIMPTYNKEEFLDKAIQSVLSQTHDNLLLCIVDDCSTDSSLAIANKYKKEDDRVLVLKNSENLGCYAARNLGLLKCKDLDWDLFTIHDSDDYSDPERLREISKPLSNPSVLGLKTTYTRVNRKGEPQTCRDNPSKIDQYASEGIAIFPKETFNIIGFFDKTRFSGDTDYWWRLQAFCHHNPQYIVGSHTQPLYSAVLHETNLTKIYNFETDRPKYFHKSKSDIINMSQLGSFRRDFWA
tara:strand:+ start:1559 stop:2293 length:735 start_codon:yes stop_codon:yes gene_type:complete